MKTSDILSRRKLIGGIGLLIAAPAIVKASNIMPVKAWDTNPCADVVAWDDSPLIYFYNGGAHTISLPNHGGMLIEPGERVILKMINYHESRKVVSLKADDERSILQFTKQEDGNWVAKVAHG